jgi:tetratricopeptide (TPR) repeat protein
MHSITDSGFLLHYRILGKIGEGGMGEVYRAEDTKLGRHVAIKLIAPASVKDEKARLRLLREARAVSSLNHPNIVTIHAIEVADGRDFLVMELVEGEALRGRTRREPYGLAMLVDVGAQIAGALAAAHSAQIIHRDIKPGNIMVTPSGLVKVLDFGLAKPVGADDDLTAAGMVVGTLAYMSPEQLRGEPVDPRTDLFSLGCVLYEVATGRSPFQGANLSDLVQQVTNIDPPAPSTIRPELSSEFDRIVRLAMAKDRDHRYETASQLRSDLRDLICAPTVTMVTAPAATSEPGRRSSLVFGRDAEIGRLEQFLDGTARGSGKVVFVSGEPGIGKTTLIEEFLRRTLLRESGVLVGRGRCVEQYGAGEAYLPFLDAVTSLLASPAATRVRSALRSTAPTWCLQLPAAFGPEARELQQETMGATKDRMVREMGDALAVIAAASPVVLIIEDLHWADAASVDLMRHLCQRMSNLRLMIVGTLRPADLEMRDHPLRTYRLEMKTHQVCEEIPLQLLSAQDVSNYLDARFSPNDFPSGLAEIIHAKTEGHSLFVTTLAQLLSERGDFSVSSGRWTLARPLPELTLDVPPSVMSMIRKQLEALSEDDRQMLQCASIQGEEFLSVLVAESLSQCELLIEERLEKLTRIHGILKSTSETELPDGTYAVKCRFSHALHQNVLYQGTLSRRRVLMHRQAGELLERHHAGQTPAIAGQLAMHFERGREFGRAIDYLVSAGDTAIARCAHAEAVERYTQALNLVPKLPEADHSTRRTTLFHKRGNAYGGLGRWEEAEADGLRMLEDARLSSDVHKQALALLQIATALFWSHQLTRMSSYTQEALELSGQSTNEKLLIDTQTFEGMRLHAIGELESAAVTLDDCIARSHQMQHKPGLAAALTYRTTVYVWQGDYARGEEYGRRAIPLAIEARNPIWTLQAYFMVGLSLVNQGRISEGLAMLRGILEQYEKNGALYHVARLSNTLGWVHRELGDFDEAARYDRQGIEFGQKYKAREGELSSWINLSREFTRTGEFDRARETFQLIEEKAAQDEWHRWLFLDIRYQTAAAEHFFAEGDIDRMDKHLQILRYNAARCGIRKYEAAGGRLAAEAAAARGDLRTAEGELAAAVTMLSDKPAPLAAWRIWASLGKVRERLNDAGGARAAYQQSASIIEKIAAQISDPRMQSAFLGSESVSRTLSGLQELSE